MHKPRFRQLLIVFSLFILLVLPTAIVGYSNFSTLVNKAFGKPFKKDEGTFTVQTESSTNIAKGSQFSLKVTTTTPKALPFKDFAAFVEFDTTKVDIKSVITQNQNQFKIVSFKNGFLLYPASMAKPSEYADLLPQTCHDAKTCDFSTLTTNTVSFSINGILLTELTAQQRPIKISLLGASEGSSTYLWNEKVMLPSLSLGTYVKNTAPRFTSEPIVYTKASGDYRYPVSLSDADSDPITLSLTCPELVFCSKQTTPPTGLALEGSDLIWHAPKAQKEPYIITIYANDGKSVTTQTFNLRVLDTNTSYFTCTFSPAISVKILDYRVETPMVIVAESSEKLSSATVELVRNGTIEKEFSYTFAQTPTSVILDQSSTPPLKYQFNEGKYTGTAIFKSVTGEAFACELDNPTVSLVQLVRQAIQQTAQTFISKVFAAVTVGTNRPPTFTSDPMLPAGSGGSTPGVSFIYGNAYGFTLRAQDPDGDPLQYTVVTKPSWAQVAISSTNPATGPSTLAIQITGVPQAKDAGSNLFSFSINDGLGHYITRTWVININYPNNDIPRVTITQPKSAITRTQGQSFLIAWDADDRNQIVSFGLYYTKNLNSGALTPINKNIAYNVRSMTVGTKNIPPGDYYFVVTATDAFNPAATGRDYTALVRINAAPKPTSTPKPTPKPTTTVTATTTPTPSVTGTTSPTPTPTVTEEVPPVDELSLQVTTPQNQADIAPADFQVVASFTASSQGLMDKKDIKVMLDGVDISESMVFQPATGKAITGTYLPKTLLEIGVHELTISAQDTKKKAKEVKITFNIKESNTDTGNTTSLFGFDVPNWLYTIFIIVLILIVIGFLLPIIMYFAFRRSNSEPTTGLRRPVNPQLPQSPVPQLRNPTTGFATVAPLRPTVSPQPQFTPVTPVVSATPAFPTSTATATVYEPPKPLSVQATSFPVASSAATTPVQTQPVVAAPVTPPPSQPQPTTQTASTFVPPRQGPQITPEQAMQSFISQVPKETNQTPQPPRPVANFKLHNQPSAQPDVPTVAPPKMATPPQVAPQQPGTNTPGNIPMQMKKEPLPATEIKKVQGPATMPSRMPGPAFMTPTPKTPSTNIPPQSPGLPK